MPHGSDRSTDAAARSGRSTCYPRNVEKARALVSARPGRATAGRRGRRAPRSGLGPGGRLPPAALRPALVDLVVGNPPYIRLEDVPDARMRAYRRPARRWRASRHLRRLLRAGAALPAPAGGRLHLRRPVDAQPVRRRPAGTGRRRLQRSTSRSRCTTSTPSRTRSRPTRRSRSSRDGAQGPAVVADTDARVRADAAPRSGRLVSCRRPPRRSRCDLRGVPATALVHGRRLWPTGSPARLAMIEDLNDQFPPLEDPATGTRVGIGVATGADSVFITDRRRPASSRPAASAAMVSDIATGHARVVGPLPGQPVGRRRHSSTSTSTRGSFGYFEAHADRLRSRHVAGRQPDRWYRTIDRVDPELSDRPKLLLPDMQDDHAPGPRRGRILPAPQPLLRHLRDMGPAGARRSAAVRVADGVRRGLLREDARRHAPVPGAVPATDPGAADQRRLRLRRGGPRRCI